MEKATALKSGWKSPALLCAFSVALDVRFHVPEPLFLTMKEMNENAVLRLK